MKKTTLILFAALLFCGLAITGCSPASEKSESKKGTAVQTENVPSAPGDEKQEQKQTQQQQTQKQTQTQSESKK